MRKVTGKLLGLGITLAILVGGSSGVGPGPIAAQAMVFSEVETMPVEGAPSPSTDEPTAPPAPSTDSGSDTTPEDTPDQQGEIPSDPPLELGEEPAPETTEPAISSGEEESVGEPEEPVDETPEVVEIASAVPVIRGTAQAGKTVSAAPGEWAPAEVTFTYQWLIDGKTVAKANTAKYTVKSVDRGKKLSVQVTGTLESSDPKVEVSKPVVVNRLLKTKRPTIGGTSKWHKYLKVKPSGWTSGAKFTYQWYRNGKAVAGSRAKQATYQIYNADWCQTLAVKVTGKKIGYESKSVTSKTLTNAGCPKTTSYHRLYAGQRMDVNQQIASTNWKHAFRMSSNGNGYLNNHGRARWASVGAKGSRMYLTPGGDLQVKKGNSVKWRSKTSGRGVKYAAINASGELGLYSSSGKLLWTASGNNGYRWNNWGTPRLSQNDGRWSGATIGYYHFGPVGCVPTAFAMAAQSYGLNVNPYSVGVQMHNGGDFNHGVAGAGGRSIVAAAQANALAATPLHSTDAIKKALKNNQPVVALVSGPYSITSPGSTHAVVLTGYYGGNTTVKNPWGNVNDQTYSLSTLWAYQSWDPLDRNAGAVFWAIG